MSKGTPPSPFNNPQDAAPYQALTRQQSLKRQFRERLASIEAANEAEAATTAVEEVNNGIDDHHFDDVDAPFDLSALAQLDTVDILTVAQNALLSSATSQTPAYVKRKASTVEQFFKILQQDLHLRRLADLLPHPDFDNQQIRRLYLEVLGIQTKTKLKVLNQCLVAYAMVGMVRADGRVMEPNTCQTKLKMLFSTFKVSFHKQYRVQK